MLHRETGLLVARPKKQEPEVRKAAKLSELCLEVYTHPNTDTLDHTISL